MNRATELRIDYTIIVHPDHNPQELEATIDYICQLLLSQAYNATSGAHYSLEE